MKHFRKTELWREITHATNDCLSTGVTLIAWTRVRIAIGYEPRGSAVPRIWPSRRQSRCNRTPSCFVQRGHRWPRSVVAEQLGLQAEECFQAKV